MRNCMADFITMEEVFINGFSIPWRNITELAPVQMQIFPKLMVKYFCDPVLHLQTRDDSFKEFSVSCEVFILLKLVARLKDKTSKE